MTKDVRLQVQCQGGNGCTVRLAWGMSAPRKVLEDPQLSQEASFDRKK